MKKKLLSLILSICCIVAVTGCGKGEGLAAYSKDELIVAYQALMNDYTALETEKNEIEALYNSLNVDSTPVAAIGYVGDATGAMTFNSRDAKIIFPTTFMYPGSQQVLATGLVSITDGIYFSPGSNWITKINGTTVEIEHSNGISGIIKVGKADTYYESSIIREDVLSPWFSDISNNKIVYNDIFKTDGNISVGVDASMPIYIDSEDAFLRCGMCYVNGYTVTYVFTYRSQQDISKDESILSIIESINIGGSGLAVNP